MVLAVLVVYTCKQPRAPTPSSSSKPPASRPDAVYAVTDPGAYNAYLARLGAASGTAIRTYADLLMALENRIAFFHEQGCRLSDHGLEQLYFFESPPFDAETLFAKAARYTTVFGYMQSPVA